MNRTVAREYWNRATAIVPTHFYSYPIGGTEKGVSHIMSARESKGSNSMFKAMHKGMRRILLLVVVGVLPFPLTPSAARAAEEKVSTGKPQAHVMLVGINDYADKQIKPRKFAEEDAKALYDLFTDKRYLGVEGDNIRLLLGSADEKRHSQPATRANIIKGLHDTVAAAKDKDLVLFAFFGEGAPLGERTCYFASDSTFKDRQKNAVAAGDIQQELDKLKKTTHFCAFIDVNYRGFDVGKEQAPEANTNGFFKEFFGNEDEEKPVPTGRVVFWATMGMGQALDLDKHGSFAQVILDGLSGKADKEGYEPDGLVTVDELAEYVDKELGGLVRKHAKTREERRLYPFVIGGRSSHFELTRNPAVTAKVQERLEKLAKLSEENKISKERADEGRKLLERMPKLESQRSLRKKYQQVVDGGLTSDDFEKARAEIMDGTKLKRSAALAFAAKVIQATETIRDNYVKEEKQHDLVVWAIKGLYQRLDEKIPQDIRKGLDNAKDMGEKELTALLADVREQLGNREDLANHKDLDIALQRMLSHLDPYTTYIDPETKKQFEQEMQGNFPGIGVQIRKDTARDMLLVVTPIRGSPAYRARPTNMEVSESEVGLKAGDVITKIIREVDSEGNPLKQPEVLSTQGMPLSDAVKKIKGRAGTKVKLEIDREGYDKPLDFEITRNRVELESVIGIKRNDDDTWSFALDSQEGIYYIRLTSFAQKTFKELQNVMKDLSKKGIKGLVLDLRFNPGGLLGSAVNISDMFIDDGLIVTVKPRIGREEAYLAPVDGDRQARRSHTYINFPMVCLVNGGSASGSEIVAACLQDHSRAIIVGERSYGKGSVQNVQQFEDGDLKVTIASFWRPNGKNLARLTPAGKPAGENEEWGVHPDKGYLIKLSEKERDDLMDYQHNQEVIPRRDHPVKDKDKEDKGEFRDRQMEKGVDYLRGLIKTASRTSAKKAG
jgi:C-terminal peptidase prc